MKKALSFFILVLISNVLLSQQVKLQGTAKDTLTMRNIPFVSVSLLASDSTLIDYSRTNQDGSFKFTIKKEGKYILLMEHPQYLLHKRIITFSSDKKNISLGNVPLFQKKQLLKRVVIKDKRAIVIQGDTISFLADSFQTKAGDVVEDLLKLLPGMEVDESGNITSQGKQVEKVLVNGEEFFGNDPTVATQNLPSKAVDKVEVFDSKDAQEQFTGFTTDKDTKVINLKLKKEYNRGLMGKVQADAGTNDRWAQNIMLNRFADKEQMSAYYLSSSNGNASMNWNDAQNYGRQPSGLQNNSSNPFGNGIPYGITKSWKGGARYANKFPNKKQELNINYGTSRTKQEREKKSFTENLLPSSTIYKTDEEKSTNISTAHALNLRYEIKFDSSLKMNIRSEVSVNEINTERSSFSDNQTSDESPISFNNTNYISNALSTNTRNVINLNKKLAKEGRTLSLRTEFKTRNGKTTGNLQSNNVLDLLNGGTTIIIDQQKQISTTNRTLYTNLVFTEALSDKLRLKLRYSFTDNVNDNSNITSDTVGYSAGNFNNQIDSLSSTFNARQITHRPGFVVRYEVDKWRVSLENELAFNQFIQEDLIRGNDFNYSQINYVPRLNLRYNFSKYRRISLRYSGRTQMPSINQMQPFQNNSNPLNVIVGNPNLRMGYFQSVSVSFSSNAPIDGHNTYIGLWASNGINQIGTSRVFDETGRTTTSYINLPNNYSATFWGYMRRKVRGVPISYSLNYNGGYRYNPNVINEIAGQNENYNLSLTPNIRYYNKELLSINANFNIRYNQSINSGNTNRTVSFWAIKPGLDISLFFPQFITINNTLSYQYTPAVAPYNTPFKRLYYHPSITKQFLPKKNLILKFEVFDLFNQNKGYDRNSDVNYNTESFYNTLGRYWLFGVSWNFFNGPAKSRRGKFGKDGSKSGQGWLPKNKRASESAVPNSGKTTTTIIIH